MLLCYFYILYRLPSLLARSRDTESKCIYTQKYYRYIYNKMQWCGEPLILPYMVISIGKPKQRGSYEY